jgi:hypothetical protein
MQTRKSSNTRTKPNKKKNIYISRYRIKNFRNPKQYEERSILNYLKGITYNLSPQARIKIYITYMYILIRDYKYKLFNFLSLRIRIGS